MRFCVVPNCNNKWKACKRGVSSHKIPAEHNRRREWLDSMQLKEPLKGNCICSDHFDKCCFLVDLQAELGFKQSKRLLKLDAVPILQVLQINSF